ncbi:MAG: alkene reductase [Planctomycetota bacterium]
MTENTDLQPLFAPYAMGPLTLQHRVLMAPMTRCRATLPEHAPHELNATYYRQRASAGLIFTEGTQISPQGQGYVATPGIYSDAQREGWKLVTDAVHQQGGLIFAQLWHVGRASHPDFQPDGKDPVAPSAIAPENLYVHGPHGKKPVGTPHALTPDEIAAIVEDFRHAATVAQDAGFDGVQLHGANGYLIDAFLRDGTNHRDDDFGGDITRRLKFPLQVLDALVDVWGADRVGIRLSPTGTFNEMSDSDPVAHFTQIFKALDDSGIGHLEVVGQLFDQPEPDPDQTAINQAAREHFSRTLIFNGDYNAASAAQAIDQGRCDLVTFGRPFLANPDLPHRFRLGSELNEPDSATLYDPSAGPKGYTDYDSLPGHAAAGV